MGTFCFRWIFVGLGVAVLAGMSAQRAWAPRAEAVSLSTAQAAAQSAVGQTPEPFYYGWRGEAVTLELSSDQICLTFNQHLSPQQCDSLLAAHNLYAPMAPGMTPQPIGPNEILRVSPVAGLDTQSAEDAFATMAGLPEVSRAFRAYRFGSEAESMLTDHLSLVVDAEYEAAALSLLVQEGCVLLYRSEYTGLGQVGLKVEVPRAEQLASGETPVERANRYHQHPSIRQASPAFAPLYPTQTAAMDPDDPYYYEGQSDLNPVEWYFDDLNMAEAWGHVYDDNWSNVGVVPAILIASMDNGVTLDYGSPGTGIAIDTNNYLLHMNGPSPYFPGIVDGHPDLVSGQWFNWTEINGDTGAQAKNDDDDGNGYDDDYFGWDFVGGDPTAGPSGTPAVFGDNVPFPDHYDNEIFNTNRKHGTRMAGRIAASVNVATGLLNSPGMPGMCPSCLLMPIRFHINAFQTGSPSGTSDAFYFGRIEQGINYAVDTGAHVLAMMFVAQTYDPMIHAAVRNARSRGRVLLAPSGNENDNIDARPLFPCVFPEVITVGASDKMDRRTGDELTGQPEDGSNFGWVVDVLAPSENGAIWGTDVTETATSGDKWGYIQGNGTSSSIPQAAGIAGLVLTENPALSPLEVQVILQEEADTNIVPNYMGLSANSGRDRFSGWGRLDAFAAVQRATDFAHQFFVSDVSRPGGRRSIMSVDTATGDFIFDGPIVEKATLPIAGPNDVEIGAIALLDMDEQTLHITGEILDNQGALTVPGTAPFSMAGVAYISDAGDLLVEGQHYATSNIDTLEVAVTEMHVNSTPDELQMTIDSANDGDIIILPANKTYDLNTLNPPGPLNYGNKQIVLQGSDPFDFDTANTTIIRAAPNQRAVALSTNQTEQTAILGLRIEGAAGTSDSGGIDGGRNINGDASTAHILYNIFVSNRWTDGGAIADVDGLIEGNMFGRDGEGNTASNHGGALYRCDAVIVENVFWYNAATNDGGAMYDCDTRTVMVDNEPVVKGVIQSNFIGENEALFGGGLALCDTVIRSNIIWNNKGTTQGGGLYKCGTGTGHVIEQNTVYGNKAGSTEADGFAMYDCDPITNRNNIFWANTNETGTVTGKQLESSTAPKFCAVDQTNDPGGTFNIGPGSWSFGGSVSDLNFKKETLATITFTKSSQSQDWHDFLHLDSTSRCIEAGETIGIPPDTFRDIDDKLGPLDGDSSGLILNDIGAHEYPSPVTIEPDGPNNGRILEGYWWERF